MAPRGRGLLHLAGTLLLGGLLAACPSPAAPVASEGAGAEIVPLNPATREPAASRSPVSSSQVTAAPVERRPAPTLGPLPAQALLTGFNHEYQRLNNCGPVTIGMALSHYGRTENQYDIAPVIKPNPQDKNVSLGEMTWYATTLGFDAVVSPAGNLDLLKRLIGEGFPVIIHTWAVLEPGEDGLGHYQLATGYNDATGTITFNDSYRGPGVRLPYARVDADWRVFGRAFIVISPPDRTARLRAILGDADGTSRAWQLAARVAQSEIAASSTDPYAWFNLGEARLRLGDVSGAVEAFEQAISVGLPRRMLWYKQAPVEAYVKSGRSGEAIALAEVTLRDAGTLEELLFWRAHARIAQGNLAGARSDLQAILDFNPRFERAAETRVTLARLTSSSDRQRGG